MDLLNDRVEKFIRRKLLNSLEKIDVVPGLCRYNYKCHMNAVHDAIENGDESLAMCVYMTEDKVSIIHFINYVDGKYIDNTLGHWSADHDYYLVKFIYAKDFRNITDIFFDYREELDNLLPWYLRWFSNVVF